MLLPARHWPADWIRRAALALLGLCAAAAPAASAQNPPPAAPQATAKSDGPRIFRSVQFAILRVDNRPPAKSWDVYLAEKSETLILVRQGVRYLLFDAAEKTVHEIREASLVARKDGVELRPTTGGASTHGDTAAPRLLASEDWVVRDVGPVRRFRARLSNEGRIFDVQLPLKLDGKIWR